MAPGDITSSQSRDCYAACGGIDGHNLGAHKLMEGGQSSQSRPRSINLPINYT